MLELTSTLRTRMLRAEARMDWGSVIWIILAVVGAALVGAGVVLLRRGISTGAKALGGACVGAGVIMWAVLLFTIPTSSTTSVP